MSLYAGQIPLPLSFTEGIEVQTALSLYIVSLTDADASSRADARAVLGRLDILMGGNGDVDALLEEHRP